MKGCVLVTDGPAAATCGADGREDERSPKAQSDAAQIRPGCTKTRKLDRLAPRKAGDTLTNERVRRDNGEQLAFLMQTMGPAPCRATDLAHSMSP